MTPDRTRPTDTPPLASASDERPSNDGVAAIPNGKPRYEAPDVEVVDAGEVALREYH